MRRLISISALFFAWLCATGVLWDGVQVVAWARMFARYAKSESVVNAVQDTFDSRRPCALCQAVHQARDTSQHELPAPTNPGRSVDRVLFLSSHEITVVIASGDEPWLPECAVPAEGRDREVPVPPPRGAAA